MFCNVCLLPDYMGFIYVVLQCVNTLDWIRSEGHTGVVRHLQANRWKMVSAADDKTLKVNAVTLRGFV